MGDARDTWTYRDKHRTTFWPRDLLAKEKFPLRVLTFGYNADVAKFSGTVSANEFNDHANDLLTDLASFRQGSSESVRITEGFTVTPPLPSRNAHEEQETRPVIFIGHSLGGLIIERVSPLLISTD